jgi:hypothetical protein
VFQSKQRRRTWSYIASRRQLLHSFAVTDKHSASRGRGHSRFPAISTLVFVSFITFLRTPLHTSVFATAQRRTTDTQSSEHNDRWFPRLQYLCCWEPICWVSHPLPRADRDVAGIVWPHWRHLTLLRAHLPFAGCVMQRPYCHLVIRTDHCAFGFSVWARPANIH